LWANKMLDVSAPHLVYFMRPERALVINRAYMDADRYRFCHWYMASSRVVPKWQQRVTLRIVANTRALGQVVGDNAEAAYHAGNVPGYRSAACRG
jgi:hypothetical protein